MSVAPRIPSARAFWREQAQRFLSLQQEPGHRSTLPLGASYHPGGWGLDDVPGFSGTSAGRWLLNHVTPVVLDEFKSVAGICAVALGAANSDDAWVEWLDCLRREGFAHKATELHLDLRHTEPRPEPDFEVEAAGLMFHLNEIRPDPDAKVIRASLLDIDDVCDASERACRRLADEALRRDLTAATSAIPGPVSTNLSPPGPNQPAATEDRSAALTVKQAAEALNVSKDTLRRMRIRDEIRMFKPGKHWRVLESEVSRLREQPRFKYR